MTNPRDEIPYPLITNIGGIVETGSPAARGQGESVAANFTPEGKLRIDADFSGVTLTTSDIQIGAVEIKSATTDARADVNSVGQLAVNVGNSLAPSNYDYVALSYDGSGNLTSSVYKIGGSAGTTTATISFEYSGSDLVSISK
jgi:hypothetical protein